ncbi:MAG TPA: DUF4190 domain-containing protein [Nocardioides sp.]|nr:DUF4190 domain-containing protein [Nocardioides sp.]
MTANRSPRTWQPGSEAVADSGRATKALVLGIVSIVFCGLFTGVPAMVLGRRAQREIDASEGRLRGRGTATAGLVTGAIGTLLSAFAIVLLLGVIALGGSFSDLDDCITVTTQDGGTATTC